MIGVVIRRPARPRVERAAQVVQEEPVERPRRRGWSDGVRDEIESEMRRYGADPRPTPAERDWRNQ